MSRRKKSLNLGKAQLTVENLEGRSLMTADLLGGFAIMESNTYEFDSAELVTDDYQVNGAEAELRLSGNITDGSPDVYQLDVEAGTTYTLQTILGTLSDSTLTVFNSACQQVAFNDDFGGGLASLLEFTATVDGSYFIHVGSYSTYQTGTYELEVSARNDSQLGNGVVSATPIQLPIFESQQQTGGVDHYFAQFASLSIPIPFPE